MLKKKELENINKYWNALNYLSAGQMYLRDNPLLRRKLELSDIKNTLIGHWGTCPGQNLIYTHLNRVINEYNLNMIYLCGPGHGGNAPLACTYLEGTYTEAYPDITMDEEGMCKLFKQFSSPGGVGSHATPELPGSINEGGELGYVLSHAYGAVLDNPSLIAAAVVGDGEAETGPLATSWQLSRFLNPDKDGVILPILHLNGFKINNPTVLSRISKDELYSYFVGLGYKPYIVSEKDINLLHKELSYAMNKVIDDISYIKANYKKMKKITYPMIVLETPKGMTGPKEIVGTFKAHQVPIAINSESDVKKLEKWLKSYKPSELFDDKGRLISELKLLNPHGKKRMGSNPITNGGLVLKELERPNFKSYGVDFRKRGNVYASDMLELGKYLKDVFKLNKKNKNFRIFGPDEAMSNRFNHVFEIENKVWQLKKEKGEELLESDGRVFDSFLSEHACEGALEGYILTGRHGLIHSYEAFVRVIDSMASQHAKWIKMAKEISWRKDIASLNFILSSHVWQQDHNGYTHQDPGFLNHLASKKADIVRMYLPFDANSLISCVDHCLGTKNYVNVIVASKHPRLQWLSMKETARHCKKGIGVFDWASNDEDGVDIVLACAGDTPTLEVLAAAKILREFMPDLRVRVVNVVDLFKLVSEDSHPHGLSHDEYDKIFTKNKPIVFNFHGYPNLIHQLTYNRCNDNLHVRGYNEEGTITTPFDMRVLNKIDRYHLVLDVLKYTKAKNKKLENYCLDLLEKHSAYIIENGEDMPEVTNFKWKE